MKIPDLTGLPVRAIILSEKHEVWTLVSAHRYDWLTRHNWNISWGSRTRWQLYAKRNIGKARSTLRMHREIMKEIQPLTDPALAELYSDDELAELHVDHINGQTLDNRDENLRWLTNAENNRNHRAREAIPSLEMIVMILRGQARRQPAHQATAEIAATF